MTVATTVIFHCFPFKTLLSKDPKLTIPYKICFDNRCSLGNLGCAKSPFGSRFRPMLSVGYAKQFTEDHTNYAIRTEADSTMFTVNDSGNKTRTDSVTASLGLQIGLTQTFALKGSVRTIFPAFKTGLAKNNVTYLAGFTWYL